MSHINVENILSYIYKQRFHSKYNNDQWKKSKQRIILNSLDKLLSFWGEKSGKCSPDRRRHKIRSFFFFNYFCTWAKWYNFEEVRWKLCTTALYNGLTDDENFIVFLLTEHNIFPVEIEMKKKGRERDRTKCRKMERAKVLKCEHRHSCLYFILFTSTRNSTIFTLFDSLY